VKKSFGLLFVALGAALASCASIQQQAVVSTPVGQNLTAGVGDIVLRVEGRESMPNAFGRADLFGRRDRRALRQFSTAECRETRSCCCEAASLLNQTLPR
jgi:hypothetical protein